MLHAQARLYLPAWVHERTRAGGIALFDGVFLDGVFPSDEDKVALAIELSRLNVEAGSGGPFGAAVFSPDHRVLSIGVNRVLPLHASLAHAENMAFLLAQQRVQDARINAGAGGPVTLATSSQPCCQCYGAAVWAGIDRLLIGARAEDVMELTEFDEGPLPADWAGELRKRGIDVVRDLRRDDAREVLKAYGEGGGGHY